MIANHFLAIGHLNIEDIQYAGRPLVPKTAGGAALYAAGGAYIWGIQVSLVSRIGDNYPQSYLAVLECCGIQSKTLRRIPGETMSGFTHYDQHGHRHYHMYSSPERRTELTPRPGDFEWPYDDPPQAAHLATMPPAFQLEWLAYLSRFVNLVSLDTDISFIKRNRGELIEALAKAHCFFPNQEEAQALIPGLEGEELAIAIGSLGPQIVVIKDGAQGSLVYDRSTHTTHKCAARPAHVIDVTGAGDAYAGGFMAAILQKQPLSKAIEMASISAAIAIEGYGALHLFEQGCQSVITRLLQKE